MHDLFAKETADVAPVARRTISPTSQPYVIA